MKVVPKHKFEAVSLLTTQSGFLDVTFLPVIGQPDWLVPTSLILSIEEYDERIWNYIWSQQDVAVYHLLPKATQPEKIIILEGNTSVHRLALQIAGELRTAQLKISEVKDIELSEDTAKQILEQEAMDDALDGEGLGTSIVYQTVMIEGETYIIPDLDTISHKLVDLDS